MDTQQLALIIFRRDLRIIDNTALQAAAKTGLTVLPIFIIDPRQVGKNNSYKSDNCIQFMLESLIDLAKQLQQQGGRLYLFYGYPDQVVTELLSTLPIAAIFLNNDYTPFAKERDAALATVAKQHRITIHRYDDLLLNDPTAIKKRDGSFYTIFTPYYNRALQEKVSMPQPLPQASWYRKEIAIAANQLVSSWQPQPNKLIFAHGGRTAAQKILQKIGQFATYKQTHDFPAYATTGLSPYLKFGCISAREAWHAITKALGAQGEPLLRQLYWRDFFTQIAYHHPRIFGHAFYEKFDIISWKTDAKKLQAWCSGTTGFPIVDAGMRQLNATGWMHNRVRMIVASLLVKDLHIDWRVGEQYFAQQLIDYDPCINNGNWQWAASTGCDAQPYFRIFNPWLQQKKFDPTAEYIKQWLPELRKLPASVIHNWQTYHKNYPQLYHAPIVDHAIANQHAKKMFAQAAKSKQ